MAWPLTLMAISGCPQASAACGWAFAQVFAVSSARAANAIDQGDQRYPSIAEREGIAIDITSLAGFHIHANHAAHLDRINAIAIALIDHKGNSFFVVIAAVSAQRPG